MNTHARVDAWLDGDGWDKLLAIPAALDAALRAAVAQAAALLQSGTTPPPDEQVVISDKLCYKRRTTRGSVRPARRPTRP